MAKLMTSILAWLIPVMSPALLLAQGTFFLKEYDLNTPSLNGLLKNQSRWLARVEKPDDLKETPANLGQHVYFFSGTIGDRGVYALLDSGRIRRLYVDLNDNQDLSDEKPITSKKVKSNYGWGWTHCYSFGPMAFSNVPGKEEAGKSAGAVSQTADVSTGKSGQGGFYAEQLDIDYLLVHPAVCRMGTVRVGSKSYRTAIIDGNFNGRYDDAFKYKLGRAKRGAIPDADVLAIDLNRNGKFSDDPNGVSEVAYLTRLIQLQNGYFTVQVAPDGNSLTIDEGRPVLGKLSIGDQEADLVVQSENGMLQLAVGPEPCSLPVGRYRVMYVVLKATDIKRKIRWSLRGRGPESKPCEFEVKADQVTSLKLGPPLVMQTAQRATRSLLSGQVVSFGVSCKDALGIEYQPAADCLTMKTPPAAPGVKIFDESGKTVSVGKFEFG